MRRRRARARKAVSSSATAATATTTTDEAVLNPRPHSTATIVDRLAAYLAAPVPCRGVLGFRVCFAAGLVADHLESIRRGEMIDFFWHESRLNFPYPGFGWVRPSSAEAMALLPYGLAACAVLFGLGLAPRLSLAAYAVGAAYLFACDAARYVNHTYLYVLLALVLFFTEWDRPRCGQPPSPSKEQKLKPASKSSSLLVLADLFVPAARRPPQCRRIYLWLLRLQFSAVYIYGGLAKCNTEWFVHHEPLRTYILAGFRGSKPLAALQDAGLFGVALTVATYFAAAFDLCVPLFLWSRRAWLRWLAAAAAAAFHVTNHFMFNTIGSFPTTSMAACLLFCDEGDAVTTVRRRTTNDDDREAPRGQQPSSSTRGGAFLRLACVGAYVAVQLAAPLRHHVYSNDVSWTRLGNEFAWRMMADTTDGWVTINFFAPDTDTDTERQKGKESVVGLRQWTRADRFVASAYPRTSDAAVTLTTHAIQQLLSNPSVLEQYVRAEISAACASGLADKVESSSSSSSSLPMPASSAAAAAAAAACPRVVVHCDCWKSVNGRAYQRWCDPTYDWNHPQGGGGGGGGGIGPRDVMTVSSTYPWMLPRLRPEDWPEGKKSPEEAAAARVAQDMLAAGWRRVDQFVERGGVAEKSAAAGPWRDQILSSAGFREARLFCAFGTLTAVVSVRRERRSGTTSARGGDIEHQPQYEYEYREAKLRQYEWVDLRIGAWHFVGSSGNGGGGGVAWVVAMK